MKKGPAPAHTADLVDRLVDLAHLIEKQEQIEESLSEMVTHIAAAAVRAGRCSIMLLKQKEGPQQFRLKICSHNGHLVAVKIAEDTDLDESISGHVAKTGRALLVNDITASPFATKARHPHTNNSCFLSAPILSHEGVAGVINFSEPLGREIFDEHDLSVARLSGLLIGRSLQVAHLQNLLKSRYLLFAISQESEPFRNGTIALDGRNSGEMAKILSRTFYREMTKAGFSTDEILGAATQIISLLGERVARLKGKQKAEETGRPDKEGGAD